MAWYVYAGIVVANYVYHRLTAESPPKPKPASEVEIPKVKEGESVSLVYGRCRVRQPIIAWRSDVTATAHPTIAGLFVYGLEWHSIIGIPFERTLSRLWSIWLGDVKLEWVSVAGGETDHTNGTVPFSFSGGAIGDTAESQQHAFYRVPNSISTVKDNDTEVGGFVQFYDGRGSQQHVNMPPPHTTWSALGKVMKDDGIAGATIPGYRGYLSVVHYSIGSNKWKLGSSPNLAPISYEVSSYPADSNALNVGLEANPAWVIVDLLTGTMGKLALAASQVDFDSFGAAAIRLQEEGNGYSRAIEAGVAAGDVLREILDQIDGVIFHDPPTNKVKIKLIRPDYDPAAIPHITTSNCERLDGFSAGGFEGAPNKVVVVFSDRSRDYQEGSE